MNCENLLIQIQITNSQMHRIIKTIGNIILQLKMSLWSHDQKIEFLRKRGVQIGERCRIYARISAFGSEPYLVKIGDHVEITSGVRFITHDGATWVFRELADWDESINRINTIEIMDNCFVGANAIILYGVRIGPNSIVGAGAVVSKDVPENSIVVGNPARVIGEIDSFFEKCKAEAIPGLSYESRNAKESLVSYFWRN